MITFPEVTAVDIRTINITMLHGKRPATAEAGVTVFAVAACAGVFLEHIFDRHGNKVEVVGAIFQYGA